MVECGDTRQNKRSPRNSMHSRMVSSLSASFSDGIPETVRAPASHGQRPPSASMARTSCVVKRQLVTVTSCPCPCTSRAPATHPAGISLLRNLNRSRFGIVLDRRFRASSRSSSVIHRTRPSSQFLNSSQAQTGSCFASVIIRPFLVLSFNRLVTNISRSNKSAIRLICRFVDCSKVKRENQMRASLA